MPISQLNTYLTKEKKGHIGANHLTTDRGLGSEIIVHVHSINLYYLICDILSLNDLFILASCPTCLLLPPEIPCHIFISWHETVGGKNAYLSMVQRMESSPPMTSCSLCGALPFDVTLCRNRRQHKENNIIWGSLGLGSRGRRSIPLLS